MWPVLPNQQLLACLVRPCQCQIMVGTPSLDSKRIRNSGHIHTCQLAAIRSHLLSLAHKARRVSAKRRLQPTALGSSRVKHTLITSYRAVAGEARDWCVRQPSVLQPRRLPRGGPRTFGLGRGAASPRRHGGAGGSELRQNVPKRRYAPLERETGLGGPRRPQHNRLPR